MASARLNHLHVLFLLQLTLTRHVAQADDQLLSLSSEMLGVVIEAAVLKERLVYSGTGLVWRVRSFLA